jgi:hypothetical protein
VTGDTLEENAGNELVAASEEVLATEAALQSAINTTTMRRRERGDHRTKEVVATAKEYRDGFDGELWEPLRSP